MKKRTSFVSAADVADQKELARRDMRREAARREAERKAALQAAGGDRVPDGATVLAVARGGGLIVSFG